MVSDSVNEHSGYSHLTDEDFKQAKQTKADMVQEARVALIMGWEGWLFAGLEPVTGTQEYGALKWSTGVDTRVASGICLCYFLYGITVEYRY